MCRSERGYACSDCLVIYSLFVVVAVVRTDEVRERAATERPAEGTTGGDRGQHAQRHVTVDRPDDREEGQ